MKYNGSCFLLAVFLACSVPTSLICLPLHQLTGIIQAPIDLKKPPEFVIRFEGKQAVSKDDGFFSFIIEKPLSNVSTSKQLSLLIGENKTHKKHKHTIKNFKIDLQKPYKYYVLSSDAQNKLLWHEQYLINKDKQQVAIPENCIFVLMDPEIVERVDVWNVDQTKYPPGPIVVLKNNRADAIGHASIKSTMEALDDAEFFEPSTMEEVTKPGVKVSLVKPDSSA